MFDPVIASNVLIDYTDKAAAEIAEGYVVHLTSLHRRPIYRYELGNFEIDMIFVVDLLRANIASKYAPFDLLTLYYRLQERERDNDKHMIFSARQAPLLNKRGVKFMNALMKRFCFHLTSMGEVNEDGRYDLKSANIYSF